jgi:hypothetical protein
MTETTTHEAARDAEVLAGVLAEPKTGETAKATPPRRARRSTAAPAAGKAPAKAATKTVTGSKAPAKAATGSKAPAKGAAKAPAKQNVKPATDKAASNGSAPSARDTNQVLAKELVDLVATHFKGHSKADQTKIANWLKVLPTGGRAHERYWPKGFARPTTSDWRAPEA